MTQLLLVHSRVIVVAFAELEPRDVQFGQVHKVVRLRRFYVRHVLPRRDADGSGRFGRFARRDADVAMDARLSWRSRGACVACVKGR
jgi:hypothetical protein